MSKRRADVAADSPSQASPEYLDETPSAADLEKSFAGPVAIRTSPVTGQVNADDLSQVIKNVLHDELAHMVADVERRLAMAYEVEAGASAGAGRSVHSRDINMSRHVIDGYTVTANSPGAGSIAWTSVKIVYNGVEYTVANGSTALKYTWFAKPASGTAATLVSSDTQPVLSTGDTLVFVNNAGVPFSVLEGTGISPAVGPLSVADSAIIGLTATKLTGTANASVIPVLDAATKLSGVANVAQIPDLAATKITSGTFGSGLIPVLDAATKLSGVAPVAVIPDLAASKITSGSFASAQIPVLDAATKLSGIAPTSVIPALDAAKITTGTFTSTQIPTLDAATKLSGVAPTSVIPQLSPSKLNLLQHLIS